MANVKLSDLIAPVFWPVWQDIKANAHTHYWFKGGRSSTKSSAISLFLILLLMADPQANAVIFRKVGDTLRNSVYEQLKWAIQRLGLENYFKCSVAPLEMTYLPTRQKILFRGVDDPLKIKSLKTAKGYFKLVWFEELAEFSGLEEVQNVLLSVMRGGGNNPFIYFYSYNPPPQVSNWVNRTASTPQRDRLVITSSYLDVPREWLGNAFLREAAHQQQTNDMLYRHIYLGEITGSGGAIFPNAQSLSITDTQIAQFDNLRQGIDWGFVNDPFCFLKLHYDSTRRDVYIFEEIYGTGISNREAIAKVDAIADPYTAIYADSAEPKSIKEFKDAALYVKAADKGPGSVEYGIKFLQGLTHIYIDPERCPNAWREFSLYELEKDRNGEWKREPPDKDNHAIDSARYALCKDTLTW
ncbi:MAG: PBSX family phage terminase large subunit [Elusimicrobiales bacterium]|nr:PBSX family phage terminase large subunit [Elusimicrobiales bacterium]